MYTLGYSFRPWRAGRGDRRRPVDPRATCGDRARATASSARSASAIASCARRWSTRGRALDGRGRARRHRRDRALDLRLPLPVQRLLRLRRGLHARVRGHRALRRPRSSIRSTGPRTSTTTGKRVVVIGSGATAVTLVPAMAETAAHVTMLQRSPSYVALASRPRTRSPSWLRRQAAGAGSRTRSCAGRTCCSPMLVLPAAAAAAPRSDQPADPQGRRAQLPPGYDVDTHFTPRYKPWDQRVCLVPDGDLFEALATAAPRSSPTSIETFTENGPAARERATSSRPT